MGLAEAIDQIPGKGKANILLMVDQFEELFRYKRLTKTEASFNESESFVKLLVEAVRQTRVPVYIVLTMRSDFIGECSQFQELTKRIERLSTVFRVTGSFYRNHSGADGTYLSDARANLALGQTIYPIYHYTEGWYQKMIVNYSADWFIRPLGMWVTFFVQQTLLDKNKSLVDPIPYATGYYDPLTNRTVSITPAESAALGLDRSYDELDLAVRSRPSDRLLFNINISKSIGRSAEISMFVHNVLDDPAFYVDEQGYYRARNHDIFYGVEFSMILDDLVRRIRGSGGGGGQL